WLHFHMICFRASAMLLNGRGSDLVPGIIARQSSELRLTSSGEVWFADALFYYEGISKGVHRFFGQLSLPLPLCSRPPSQLLAIRASRRWLNRIRFKNHIGSSSRSTKMIRLS